MIGRKGNSFISCGSTSLAGIRNGAGRDVFSSKFAVHRSAGARRQKRDQRKGYHRARKPSDHRRRNGSSAFTLEII